jgi:capsular exopolysaccharide synthesis family protein
MPQNSNEDSLDWRHQMNYLKPPIEMVTASYNAGETSNTLNWEQAARIIRKNWKLAGGFALVVTALIASYASMLKDTYRPVARLEIDPPGSGALSPRDAESILENNQEYLETQTQILQSDDLAIRVIRALHLDRNPEIVGEKSLKKYAQKTQAPLPAASLQESIGPQREMLETAERTPLEAVALRRVQQNLGVNIVRGSRLVEVSYTSNSPRLAQQVTNELVSQFIDRNFKTRYLSTTQASDWLSGQLNDLRQQVEKSNQAVVDYQKRYGIVEENEKDGPSIQLLTLVAHQFSDAKADRIQHEAYIRMIQAGQTESLPQVQADQVYQTLTSQYAESSARLAQAKAVYGEANTNYKKIENEVNELASQRSAEEGRITEEIRTAYNAALQRELLMTQSLNHYKSDLANVNQQMIRYTVLKNDAKANTELYETLLSRLKEAGVYSGLKSSNIRIVDAAAVLDRPTGPHRTLILTMGMLMACLFSIVLAFGRESFDNTVRSPDDVREWTGLSSLAIFPLIEPGKESGRLAFTRTPAMTDRLLEPRDNDPLPIILSATGPTLETETLRELGTSLLLPQQNPPLQVILVASSSAGEGKSTVALNLAIALSEQGRTCLLDADLRKPTASKVFGVSVAKGWSDFLAGAVDVDRALVNRPEMPNLSLCPVGTLSNLRGRIVASEQMKELLAGLRSKFKYVVIDSPPAIPFPDARIWAQFTDGVILVGRYGTTTRRALTRCAQRLQQVGAFIAGVILNGVDFTSADYQYYNFGHRPASFRDYKSYLRADGKPHEEKSSKVKAAGA